MLKESLMFTLVTVAPLAGAWIEILLRKLNVKQIRVAPLAGAWIEIGMNGRNV